MSVYSGKARKKDFANAIGNAYPASENLSPIAASNQGYDYAKTNAIAGKITGSGISCADTLSKTISPAHLL